MQEHPLIEKKYTKNTKKLAVVFPNLYYGGVYSLGTLIIYNSTPENWICDRFYLDKIQDLSSYNLVGFSFQYELDLNNIRQIKQKYKPKITFAGGPVCNMNPLILKDEVDFQILGEVENILPKILELYIPDKQEFLKRIKNIPGIYTGNKITYTEQVDLDKVPYPLYQPLPKNLTKEFVFGSTFILEIERGCPFLCKFCEIRTNFPKIKYRSLTNIKKIIDQGLKLNNRNKVTIYSPSFTHPNAKEILQYLVDKKVRATIPSMRLEIFNSKELLELVKQLGQTSLTTAPECNESLRFKVSKHTKDEVYFEFAKLAQELGFKKLKLYFIYGLPEQTMKDLKETIEFIKKIASIFPNIYLSFNPFVPKKTTPFEKEKFADKKTLREQKEFLKKNLSNYKLKIASEKSSLLAYRIMQEYS